jgi:hypothetical protein
VTETTYDEIATWRLANGDKVIVVRATIHQPDALPHYKRRYHWTVVARNGEKVATSGETFTRARSAKRAAARSFPPPE